MYHLIQKFKLTPELQDILRNQSIDYDAPGTILQDFNALLDFVLGEKQGVPVTGTHLLPLKVLQPLNERLSNPLQLGL